MADRYPAASLLGCPDEIRISILTDLTTTDYVSLCSTHSRLRAVAEPFLYAQIDFTWQEGRAHPITTLIWSILRRPQLASHIRSVSLIGASFYRPHYRASTPRLPVPDAQREVCLAFVSSTGLSFSEGWMQELRGGSMEAYIAVLLCQPLRLQYLLLDYDYFKESRLLGQVLHAALLGKHNDTLQLDVRSLHTIVLQRWHEEVRDMDLRNTADILPLFYLPAIRHLSVAIDNPVDFSWPTQQAPVCSSLQSLKVTLMREDFLQQLLRVTPQLRSFEWQWFDSHEFACMGYAPHIDLERLMQALSCVQATLESLVISALPQRDGEEFPFITFHGSWRDLPNFTRLRTFEVPLYFLIGASINQSTRLEAFLPPKLEYLTIKDDICAQDEIEWSDAEVFDLLETWLTTLHASTPGLKGLTVKLSWTANQWKQPLAEKLRKLCETVGIRAQIVKLRHDRH